MKTEGKTESEMRRESHSGKYVHGAETSKGDSYMMLSQKRHQKTRNQLEKLDKNQLRLRERLRVR